MRKRLIHLLAGALVLSLAPGPVRAADPAKPEKADSAIATPFHAWMVTGKHAGRYHCPVCDHGLNPVVLVFIREIEGADKPVFNLLKKLDDLAAQHADVKLGVCAVFLNDAGLRDALGKSGEDYVKKYAETTIAKQDLEGQLRGLAKEKGLQNVEFALDAAAGPLDYKLDENKQVTVLFYDRHNVLAREPFAKDKFTDADAKKILGQVAKTIATLEARLRKRASRP